MSTNFNIVQAKHDFLSFLSALLNWRKKSNFFKLAVLQSSSMKWNHEGLIFNESDIYQAIIVKLRVVDRSAIQVWYLWAKGHST